MEFVLFLRLVKIYMIVCLKIYKERVPTIKLHTLCRQQYKMSLSIQAALKKLEVQNNKLDSSTTGCTLKSSLRSL